MHHVPWGGTLLLISRLPPKRFSRTGRGTRDAARTAALFGRPCYQRPFSRGVVSRATAPQLEKKTLSRTSADGRWLVPVTRVLLLSAYRLSRLRTFQTWLRNMNRIPFRHKFPSTGICPPQQVRKKIHNGTAGAAPTLSELLQHRGGGSSHDPKLTKRFVPHHTPRRLITYIHAQTQRLARESRVRLTSRTAACNKR